MHRNGLHVWNGSLARSQATFRTIAGSSIIDLFISMDQTLYNPALKIYEMTSLNTHHHLCSLSFSLHTPWNQLPTPNSPRQHWKLQRLSDPEVRQLYLQQFEDNIKNITQLLDHRLNNTILDDPSTIEQLDNQLRTAIYDALDSSLTRSKPRPKRWKSFWNDELQHKADQRKKAYQK